MTFSEYKRELKMVIDNTYELYEMALGITDFDWQGEQVDELYVKAWATINENAGANVAPTLYTDHDVLDVKQVVIDTAKKLQELVRG